MLPTENEIQKLRSEVIFNREEAAAYLGVSPSTLANWASTKKFVIPYCRVGRSVRYRKRDLDAFMESGFVG